MSRKLLFVLLVVICLNLLVAGVIAGMVLMPKPTFTYASPTSTPKPTPNGYAIPTISAEKLMAIVNNWRQTQGFQTYENDELACSFASKRLTQIETNFSHDPFFNEVPLHFPPRVYVAENLSKGYDTEQETLDAWLVSTEHRKNLDANYQYSCIRCEFSFCVQVFTNYE
jgi:uncharacterized protein YkwD